METIYVFVSHETDSRCISELRRKHEGKNLHIIDLASDTVLDLVGISIECDAAERLITQAEYGKRAQRILAGWGAKS